MFDVYHFRTSSIFIDPISTNTSKILSNSTTHFCLDALAKTLVSRLKDITLQLHWANLNSFEVKEHFYNFLTLRDSSHNCRKPVHWCLNCTYT